MKIADQLFHCPHCGAPGSVLNGGAMYSCLCRFGSLSRSPQDQPEKKCTCKPPESGPSWGCVYATDWQCPIHGGLLQNASTATSEANDGA